MTGTVLTNSTASCGIAELDQDRIMALLKVFNWLAASLTASVIKVAITAIRKIAKRWQNARAPTHLNRHRNLGVCLAMFTIDH